MLPTRGFVTRSAITRAPIILPSNDRRVAQSRSDVYWASSVGLATSAKEVSMFACMEYLACWLPALITGNRGVQI
jgi:hypothetical protein